jgi:hypothetical protein
LVSRELIARGQAAAPRIDADRFRADLDAVVDPSPEAGEVGGYAD